MEIVEDTMGKAVWVEEAGVGCIEGYSLASAKHLEETVSGLLDFLTKFNFFCILRTL